MPSFGHSRVFLKKEKQHESTHHSFPATLLFANAQVSKEREREREPPAVLLSSRVRFVCPTAHVAGRWDPREAAAAHRRRPPAAPARHVAFWTLVGILVEILPRFFVKGAGPTMCGSLDEARSAALLEGSPSSESNKGPAEKLRFKKWANRGLRRVSQLASGRERARRTGELALKKKNVEHFRWKPPSRSFAVGNPFGLDHTPEPATVLSRLAPFSPREAGSGE